MATQAQRRRRAHITDRGSDRLAFITGNVNSLPPLAPMSPVEAFTGQVDSLPLPAPPSPPTEIHTDSAQHEDADSVSPLPKSINLESPLTNRQLMRKLMSIGAGFLDANDEVSKILSSSNPNKPGCIISRAVALLGINEDESETLESFTTPLQHETHPHPRPRPEKSSAAICSRISAAIVASESVRACCSVAAAILAIILSYAEFPFLGRPVYLLLLTNVWVVAARVVLGTDQVGGGGAFGGGNVLLDRVGKVVEVGLMLRKIVEALVMDFGVYMVVLICGFWMVRIWCAMIL